LQVQPTDERPPELTGDPRELISPQVQHLKRGHRAEYLRPHEELIVAQVEAGEAL
jgi:hypothetical protein